jgi:hypothetical protein
MRLEEMTFEQIYLEYYNNFSTIDRMAEYYQVPSELLRHWVDIGKGVNNAENWDEFQKNINELYYSLI